MASKLPDTTKSLGAGAMDVEDGSGGGGKKVAGKWPGFVHFFFVLTVVMCALVYAPRFLSPAVPVDFLGPRQPSPSGRAAAVQGRSVHSGRGNEGDALVLDNQVNSPCAWMGSHGICCDRSDYNTDVCFIAGDVRTDAASLSLLLYPPPNGTANANANATVAEKEEVVRPYTRKWEKGVMANIQEVRLRAARPEEADAHRCDVRHDAPALVMTAGGYTGNLFHAFNDGFLPVWLTVQHLRRRVVLAVLEYNPWWAGTFPEVVSGLSRHHVIDILHDKRTHCFPGAIVGTRFHGILEVDPARTRDNRTLVDFHDFLAGAYKDDGAYSEVHTTAPAPRQQRRPRLGLYSRKGTRVIENEGERGGGGAAGGVGGVRRVRPGDGERGAAVVGVREGERVRRAGGRARRGPDQAALPPAGPRRAAAGGAAGRAGRGARLLREGDDHDGDALRAVRRGGERELAGPEVRGGRRGAARPGGGDARARVGPHRARVPQRPERDPRPRPVRRHPEEAARSRPAAAGGRSV
ncbi:hypothetical protein CFC21_050295, partial [Triticum aestivum]